MIQFKWHLKKRGSEGRDRRFRLAHRPRPSLLLLGSLLALALSPTALLAQESEAPETVAQTAEAQQHKPQDEDGIESENAEEDTEETEEPSAVEDIIPSEMISEDLAVDFPIDI